MEMGLQLENSFLTPALYTGITLAIFTSSGTIPVSKEQFIMSANGSATISIVVLATQETILSCPELFLFFNVLQTEITSINFNCITV